MWPLAGVVLKKMEIHIEYLCCILAASCHVDHNYISLAIFTFFFVLYKYVISIKS